MRALADAADEPDTQESREMSVGRGPDAPPVEQLPAEPARASAGPHRAQPARANRAAEGRDAPAGERARYIHGHGLVHRDLKPSNVMVDEDRLVRLMDFGLAKFLADDGAVTADGRLVGTFRYMAPEQILGEGLDARADLYSLGVILYELLTGRTPFDARTPYELWQKVLETDARAAARDQPAAPTPASPASRTASCARSRTTGSRPRRRSTRRCPSERRAQEPRGSGGRAPGSGWTCGSRRRSASRAPG